MNGWIGLVCVVFVVSALPATGLAKLVDRIVAIVNNDIILLSDLEKAMNLIRAKLKQEGYSETQQRLFLADQRSNVLDQLINEKLTDQQIKRYKIEVEDAEIDATIQRIKEVNNFSDERLRQMIEMDGLTWEEYRKQIKEQLLRTKLVNLEVKSKIVITDEDVQTYYDEHRDKYAGQTKYHLRHILMKVDPDAAESENQKVFQSMQQIYEKLHQGESFAQMAQAYSEAATAQQGGDLGVFEARLLAPQIRQALEKLEKGQFTPVVETEQGYQLFYIENIIDAGGRSIEEAKAEIQDKLYADIVDQKFESWLKSLRQGAHIKTLD